MKLVFKIIKPSATFHGVGYSDKKQKKGTGKLLYAENFGHLHFGNNHITKKEFE